MELPEQIIKAGTAEYHEELVALKAEMLLLKTKQQEQEVVVSSMRSQMEELSRRVDVLEVNLQKYVVDVESIAEHMNSKLAEIDARLQAADINSAHRLSQQQIHALQQEQEEWKALKALIRSFNKNVDLRQHYAAMVSELEAAYIAAQAIASEQVDRSKSKKFAKVGEYLGLLASMMPMVGQIASHVIQGFGIMADIYTNVKDQRDLKRLRALAADIHSFDMIAIHIAVQITLAHREQIIALDKAVVEPTCARRWESLRMAWKRCWRTSSRTMPAKPGCWVARMRSA